jgi:hypothetical protein
MCHFMDLVNELVRETKEAKFGKNDNLWWKFENI